MATRQHISGAAVAVALVLAGCASDDGNAEVDDTQPAPEPPTEAEPEPEPEPAPAPEPEAEREPEAEPDTSRPYDFSSIGPIVQGFVDDRGLNGAGLIVVHRDDGVIHHQHWGEFTEDRISLIASSTKMITAGVLMHLDDEGLLDVDAPVADVVGWGAGNPDVTPAQLVSNSSGLVGLAPNPIYGPYLCQFLVAGSLQECGATIFETADDDADVIEPDTEFRYGGAQWQVAGAVAEAASGQAWAELIEEIYVEPCDLDALAYNNHFSQIQSGFEYPAAFDSDPATLRSTDNPNMEGGAYVTTGDYGKLLLMHLRGGVCGDTQVLSSAALDRMHGDRVAEVYDGDAGDLRTGYGMGWWVDRDSGRISDAGAYGTVPWLDLEDGYGAYLVVEANSDVGSALANLLYDPIDDAVNAP